SFKDPASALRTLEELGPEVQHADDASARKLSSGAVIWAGLVGRTLLTAGSRELLISTGGLALEAQRVPRDGQVMLSLYPQNLAKAQGVPLATLVQLAGAAMSAKLDAASEESAAKGGQPSKGK